MIACTTIREHDSAVTSPPYSQQSRRHQDLFVHIQWFIDRKHFNEKIETRARACAGRNNNNKDRVIRANEKAGTGKTQEDYSIRDIRTMEYNEKGQLKTAIYVGNLCLKGWS